MEMEDATWRVEHGEPPTEEAEHEWYRMERERLRRQEERMRRAAGEHMVQGGGGMDGAKPAEVTRTTAEPRPNAYIPDDIGIPKPYGALAPFKPTELGATMRHIRRPQPPPLEL